MIESIVPSWGQYSRLDIEALYFQPKPENIGLAPGLLVERKGGYKGDSYMDSGYFYAPYIALRAKK